MEKIILAPKTIHKSLLLNARKEDIFVNPKIVTREELLEKYYGRITNEGLYYLFVNNNICYDNLIQLIPYITRTNENCKSLKNAKLYEYKKELESRNLIERDEFFDQFVSNKEIEIIGYSENDSELISLLNKINISYKFKPFSKGNHNLTIKKFSLLEDEVFYMLNNISSLIESGVSPEDILIYTSNENCIFYIKMYHDSFGFKINFPNSESLYSQESVSVFLKIAKETMSFDLAFNAIPDAPKDIVETLKELCVVDLDFDKKIDYISSVLKSRKIQETRYDMAVNIICDPIFEENKHIFIPCFAQNIYPKSFKDIEYISDVDKEELDMLTSLDKCRIEDSISKNFLLTNNIFYLSRSSACFAEKYFESPYCNSLNIKEIEINDIDDTIYSEKYAAYKLGIDLDKKLYFLQQSKYSDSLSKQVNIKYREYDNSYTNAEAISPNDFLKLSYSSADKFFKCPFSYYLDKVLGINDFVDNFGTKLGKVAHYVFEHQLDDDFDFDKAYEKVFNEYEWSNSEILFLERLKEDIKIASDTCILYYDNYAFNPKVFNEIELKTDIAPNTILYGRIDKIMILDDTYAVFVDYKTDKSEFSVAELDYGLSMQLPTYAYLFSTNDKYKDYVVSGMYLNNVLNFNFSVELKEDDIVYPYLRLNGLTLFDLDAIMKIDPTLVNGKTQFIAGLKTTKSGAFDSRCLNRMIDSDNLKALIEKVHEKYLEANNRIRNNEFEISPLFFGTNGACKYCQHKDICFVKKSQRRGKIDSDGDE